MANIIYHSQYTAEQMEAAQGKTPIIQNGTWWTWDIAQMTYVDTTAPALAWVGTQAQYDAIVDKDYRQVYCIVEAVTSIAVTAPATKSSYTVGETLDLTGLVVTAAYPSGAEADVTSRCVFTPAEGATLDTAGTVTVNVSFTEDGVAAVTSFTVTVAAAS